MKNVFLLGLISGGLYFVCRHLKQSRLNRRKHFIQNFLLPVKIKDRLLEVYPHLTANDLQEVIRGLKEYFYICNMAGRHFVSMPSQVVDLAWHEFILYTKQYHAFCQKAFGRFLHHVPAEAMRSPTMAQEGIKKAWRLSCLREKIKPDAPSRLPILFNLDAKLNIPGGFYYTPNCKGANSSGFCASDIGGCGGVGCGSGDAGSDNGCGGGD